MIESNDAYCMCSLDGIMDILGKKWVLLVLNSIGNHRTVRFGELYKELKGISPSTLSSILRDLTGRNIVRKEIFPQVPLRVEYTLTDTGVELRASLLPLLKWAGKYDTRVKEQDCCDANQYVSIL